MSINTHTTPQEFKYTCSSRKGLKWIPANARNACRRINVKPGDASTSGVRPIE